MNQIAETGRLLKTLEESQWKSPEEFQSLRMLRLGQLFDHVYRTVPFYKPILDQVGYQLGQEITEEFFQSLPILTRSEIQSAQDTTLISTSMNEEAYSYPLVTSGSTGVGVRLLGTFSTSCYWKALCLREHLWHQRDFSKTLAAIRWATRNQGLPPLGEIQKGWGDVTENIFETGPGLFLNVSSPTASQVDWLKRMNPDYLITFPSQLKDLLRHFLADSIEFSNLKEFRTIGETVDNELRELSKNYGVKLTDGYSSEEFGALAFQCPEEMNYHVQSENVYIEIIDDDGNLCDIGEEGRVVVTALHNFATPLIRYDIGDYAQLGEPCSCGRNALPVLQKILGRKRNRLTMPWGEKRFPLLGDREERRKIFQGTRKFQYIQHSPTEIEMKLVVEKPMTPDQEAAMIKIIQKDFGHPFDVRFSYHDDIPRQANGKFEEFISHCCCVERSSFPRTRESK